jgi:ubiquinone/menaquinone biosynthesis C-methylase UbiE
MRENAPDNLPANPQATEAELVARIEPWLAHMRWRPNFAAWRAQRIAQENHQHEALRLLAAGLDAGQLATHDAANTSTPLRLLDLGCGMGGFAVAAALRGMQVVALDYNPAYAAITALRAARHGLPLPVAVAAGEALPLPAASLDVVTCWDVLEHVQSPDAMLAELARLLRPGGVLLLTAINRFAFRDPHYHLPLLNWLPRPLAEALIAALGRRKGGAFRDRQRLSEMHYFTWGALRRLAARHGFRLLDLDARRVASGAVGQRWRWLAALGAGRLALPAYYVYRTVWQGTWRVVLVKQADTPRGTQR